MDKLKEILQFYEETYTVTEPLDEVYAELMANNVEVKGDSFFCPIKRDGVTVLLAGTKTRADIWVLKKIVALIKTGEPIVTLFNGNSEHLIMRFKRFGLKVVSRDGDTSIITFNMKDKEWR